MTFTIKQGELFWIDEIRTTLEGAFPKPVFKPPAARSADPATSHAAAADIAPRASKGRLLAMRLLLEHGPMTDFELAAKSGLQQTSIGKRRGELMKAGLVKDARLKARAPSGSWAASWVATEAGRRWYEANRDAAARD